LERIVLSFLQLQFPLSAQSLRFAARIPPLIGANELVLFLFLYFGFLKNYYYFEIEKAFFKLISLKSKKPFSNLFV
jgi:hypothetical protein